MGLGCVMPEAELEFVDSNEANVKGIEFDTELGVEVEIRVESDTGVENEEGEIKGKLFTLELGMSMLTRGNDNFWTRAGYLKGICWAENRLFCKCENG